MQFNRRDNSTIFLYLCINLRDVALAGTIQSNRFYSLSNVLDTVKNKIYNVTMLTLKIIIWFNIFATTMLKNTLTTDQPIHIHTIQIILLDYHPTFEPLRAAIIHQWHIFAPVFTG